MNIIIAGGRDFKPNEKHKEWLINILLNIKYKNINIVCGMAKVSDICILFPGGKGTMHMKNIAKEHGLKIILYKNKQEE